MISFLTKFNFFLCIFAQTYSPIFASDELLTLPAPSPLPDSAPRALAKVQQDCLVKYREQRSLSQAIRDYAPFRLIFRGPLPE